MWHWVAKLFRTSPEERALREEFKRAVEEQQSGTSDLARAREQIREARAKAKAGAATLEYRVRQESKPHVGHT